MPTRLIQLQASDGARQIAAMDDRGAARIVQGFASVYALALDAIDKGRSLQASIDAAGDGGAVDLRSALAAGCVLAPVDHPDPAHLFVTGTGLTHLGSAEGRDKMHRAEAEGAPLTDSMKMFRLGLDGGKPAPGAVGVQPEWFYKGDGGIVARPGGALDMPAFALDGGEEPELVGVYVIGRDGAPYRLGIALGNEFSDHVTERQNYLYLAHSKLRACAFGPELLVGDLPNDVRGASRIRRRGDVIWEKAFLSGENNMCHSIANLEQHHFKYAQFRRPGDVHVHYFGTATLSFSDGVRTAPGDTFEIEAAPFLLPLTNTLHAALNEPVAVRAL